MRGLALLFALPLVAAANPPAQQFKAPAPTVARTYRDYEVPRAPVTVREYVPVDRQIEQPPARFREVTETHTYHVPLDEPAPRAAAVYAAPRAKVHLAAPVYAAPVYVAPATVYAAPVYTVAPLRYGAPLGHGLYNTPSGRPAAPGIVSAPGAPFPLDGPVRRGIRAALGYDQ